MNEETLKAIKEVIDYLEPDEKTHWQELGRPANHIYNSVRTLKQYVAHTHNSKSKD